jgi:ADP-heptose:LPS heptosyltransferase
MVDHAVPKRILVLGPSNIGDAILMSPVIERLRAAYPQAHVTLISGERSTAVFSGDPRVQRLVCLDEFEGVVGRLRLVRFVWTAHPDLLIDLRSTILPLAWRPWTVLRYLRPIPRRIAHMRDRHLWRAKGQGSGARGQGAGGDGCPIWIPREAVTHVGHLLKRWGVDPGKRLVLICAGARSHIKRWNADRFSQLADRLIGEMAVEVIFTGEPDEGPIIQDILGAMRRQAHTAVGSTTLQQLAALMQRADLVITNDSASLHLACAVRIQVLALFGPTDPRKYGPTGAQDRVIQRRLFCVPCEQALCRFSHECMRFISVEEVFDAARHMLEAGSRKYEVGGQR